MAVFSWILPLASRPILVRFSLNLMRSRGKSHPKKGSRRGEECPEVRAHHERRSLALLTRALLILTYSRDLWCPRCLT